jgi:glutamate 5-kinase
MNQHLKIVFEVEEKQLVTADKKINRETIDLIAMLLTNFMNGQKQVILVSAGAIAAGVEKLQLSQYPKTLFEKQAVAAIGQVELIRRYQNMFDQYNQMIGQVLLDRNILKNPKRQTNAKNTFDKLLKQNVIPIINENDVTSIDDIEEEDNYPLTAVVANHTKAHILIQLNDDYSFNVIEQAKSQITVVKDKNKLFSYIDSFEKEIFKDERQILFPFSQDDYAYFKKITIE